VRHGRGLNGCLWVRDHARDIRGVAATSDRRKLGRQLSAFPDERVAPKTGQLIAKERLSLGAVERCDLSGRRRRLRPHDGRE
jgi:hypothetical protein